MTDAFPRPFAARARPPARIPRDFAARPDTHAPAPGALDRWLRRLWSPPAFSRRIAHPEQRLLARIEAARPAFVDRDAAGLREALVEVRAQLRAAPDGEQALARAFALVARFSALELGLDPYPAQLAGALLIHRGFVAEMATGEGKTLTVMLAAAVRALSGNAVHVVTVNDYLAQRDCGLASGLMRALGLACDVVVEGLPEPRKRLAYRADVVYCSNKELVFDFLRGRLASGRRPEGLVRHAACLADPGGLADGVRYQFAIVDEADSVLLDEALTPLVIAAPLESPAFGAYASQAAIAFARTLTPGDDFRLSPDRTAVSLTPRGERRAREWLDPGTPELDFDRIRIERVTKALRALHVLVRDKAYIVHDGKVRIVDEGTGRVLGDRSWEDGLHQMVEAKEGVEVSLPRQSVERIAFQQFFMRYHTLSGTTGTAREVAGELFEHYRLRVVAVPLHKPSRRRTLPACVFGDRRAQFDRVRERIVELAGEGRPVLVGTRTVEESERLAAHLRDAGIGFELLNARRPEIEAEAVAQAGRAGRVTVATNMAGRGTDILLGPGVASRGGLHVILTELHDAQRIDRQLAGRCARQGDPGSFEMLLRLDPGSTLGAGLDRLLLRLPREVWPASGRGFAPALMLAARRLLQRVRQGEHAAMRRRLVAHELRGDGLDDF